MAGKKTTNSSSNRTRGKATSPAPKGKGKTKGELTDQDLDQAAGGMMYIPKKLGPYPER